MFHKMKVLAEAHKFIAGIVVVLLAGGAYAGYQSLKGNSATEVRYVLAAPIKGTITTSVSGSGQVSVSQQVDVKTKSAGEIVAVHIKKGQEVKAGALLAQLDTRDAQKAVRDAQINLESAQIAMEKLKKPADKLSVVQAENSLAQAKRELADLQTPPDSVTLLQAQNSLEAAKESKQKAQDDLKKSYEDGIGDISSAFLDFPTMMTGLSDMFFGKTVVFSQENIDWYTGQVFSEDLITALKYKDDFRTAYAAALDHYTKNAAHFQSASYASPESTEDLIEETLQAATFVADAVKSANNYVDFAQSSLTKHNSTIPAVMAAHQATLDSYTAKANTHSSSLLAAKRSIEDNKNAGVGAERSIAEKAASLEKLNKGADANAIQTAKEKIREREESLKKLKAGAEVLDIKSQDLTLRQRTIALADAREKLTDATVRAPFDGIIAKADIKKGDSLASGAIAATLITKQRMAEISLNEVDVAKVKAGQKTTLTFDAVENLTITGEVAELDALGTVSQGVVTYGVKILFDTQDERVKPGMSVSASIITDIRQDVLIVPNGAIKTQGDASYVEMFDEPFTNPSNQGVTSSMPPRQQIVEVGISNDTSTEITSGLKESDQIIIRTLTTSAATSTQAPSIFRGGTGLGGGGGAFRIPR